MSSRSNPFELILESRFGGVVINFILIPLLILSALLLPPISLADRLLSIGYESIGRDGGAVQDPDGTQITFPEEGIDRSFRVKLSAVPRSLFLEGSAGDNLLAAAESIPPNLIMKSPYYQIQVKGSSPEQANLKIPIPNEAEPYSTMDLYAWNGESWVWLSSRQGLDENTLEENTIEVEMDFLPEEYYWLIGATHRGFADGITEVRNTFGSNISFKREVLDVLGGFRGEMGVKGSGALQGEETEMCERMKQRFGKGVMYNPDAVVHHKIFSGRMKIKFLLRRAFWQGYSKRAMKEMGYSMDVESDFLKNICYGILARIKNIPILKLVSIVQMFFLLLLTFTVFLGYSFKCVKYRS